MVFIGTRTVVSASDLPVRPSSSSPVKKNVFADVESLIVEDLAMRINSCGRC